MNTDSHLAVIGLAARFPGARDAAGFWRNLAAGVESVVELPAPEGAAHQPACGVLDDADCFDAEFFGYAPRDALVIDPQHRIFLECAWEALEHAGHDPSRFPGPIGVYAGSSQTGYAELLRSRRDSELLAGVGDFALRLGCGLDFLTTRVAYKFGLRGPAVTVQTACSTSLVAVHLAGQALLAGECDMALAGGVTVHVPPYPGEFSEEGILSRDGHCRAFDAKADGTVGGDGAGVVVLRRLADALADGDTIHAVVLGTAVNNDGADKIGYTAPGVTGQADAVMTALSLAEVPSDSVTYVETHGTGTPLGDPIEIAALAIAFRATADDPARARPEPCLIGSAKTNIGHTDAAAGVAGFIKTVLALSHRRLPPSLNFSTPNPDIDFADAGFEVNTRLREWTAGGAPRRAGVNSLGIGGTNAHAVLEEGPAFTSSPSARRWHLVPISARSRRALASVRAGLSAHLASEAAAPLADVAWTLQVGRHRHACRQFAVVSDLTGLADALDGKDLATGTAKPDGRPLAFLFPGQGGQSVGMTRQVYEDVPFFRESVDECACLFASALGTDLRDVLYADPTDPAAAARLEPMTMAQACVFTVEYALARLWLHWGVTPDAVAGHSLGTYAAACIAGVFDLPGAVTLVAARGRLLESLPRGAMTAVTLPEPDLRELLAPGLDLATVNGPDQCVVSGAADLLEAFEARLAADGVHARRLAISAAAHSALVDAVVPEFRAVAAGLRLVPPTLPVVSDHTGTWLTDEEACDPAYWAAHLRGTVRFSDALSELLAAPSHHDLLEVGPGGTLASLARRHPSHHGDGTVLASMPHAPLDVPEYRHLLDAAGRLWLTGRDLDWEAVNAGEARRRVALPTYPFQRLRFLIGPEDRTPVRIEPVEPGGEQDEDDAYTPPSGATERAVAGAFGQILGLPRVGADDSFLGLGGDSLTAAQLTSWIRREYGLPVTVRAVFKAPTVAAMARLIESTGPAAGPIRPPTRSSRRTDQAADPI